MTRILYLHGFASAPSSRKARYLSAQLERAGFRVDVPALAADDFQGLTISGQLRIIEQTAAGEAVSIVGSSMGGYLAALYSVRHPEVERLVLLAPAFGFVRRWAERLGPAQTEQWSRQGMIEVFHYGENCNRNLGYGLIEDGFQYEDYPDFRQSALIFHGAQDDIVPVSYSEEFAATHPNARLEVLDSGHDLLNVLDQIGPETVEFLSS